MWDCLGSSVLIVLIIYNNVAKQMVTISKWKFWKNVRIIGNIHTYLYTLSHGASINIARLK